MVSVRVQNCQSIKDATIVLDGLTVITGPNNSGKTAFMRAIRALFTNGRVGPLIRQGAKDLIVTLECDRGTVEFKKGKTKPTYTFWGEGFPPQGKELHPGSKVPEELGDFFGVFPLQVGNNKIWPQIATQFATGPFSGPMFLLDQSGSIMAEVVSDVEKVGRLSRAVKACASDSRKANGKLSTRKEDLAKAQAHLAKFDGLDEVGDTVSRIDDLVSEATSIKVESERASRLHALFQSRTQAVEALAGIHSVHLPDSETMSKAQKVGQAIEPLRSLHRTWERSVLQVESLKGISDVDVPSLDQFEELRSLLQEAAQVSSLSESWNNATKMVNRLAGIAEVVVPTGGDDAHKVLEKLREIRDLHVKYQAAVSSVAATQGANDLADLDLTEMVATTKKVTSAIGKLQSLSETWTRAKGEVENLSDEIAVLEDEIPKHEEHIHQLMGELGITACPECGTLRGAS